MVIPARSGSLPAQRLLPTLRERSEAALIVQAIDQHLVRNVHQVATLDFAEPTLAENPLNEELRMKRDPLVQQSQWFGSPDDWKESRRVS